VAIDTRGCALWEGVPEGEAPSLRFDRSASWRTGRVPEKQQFLGLAGASLMKIASERRLKVIAGGGSAIVAILLTGRGLLDFDDSHGMRAAPRAGAADAVACAVAARPSRVDHRNVDGSQSLDLVLRDEGLRATETSRYEGSGRNIFRALVDVKAVRVVEQERPRPDPPKVLPPPIGLKFFGLSWMGGERRVFLSKDEDVFMAKEGEIVDRRYRVVRIMPNAVELEDMLNSRRQMLWLGRG